MNFCPNCGKILKQNQKYCANCGLQISNIDNHTTVSTNEQKHVTPSDLSKCGNKKQNEVISFLTIAGIIICVIGIILYFSFSPNKKTDNHRHNSTPTIRNMFNYALFWEHLGNNFDELKKTLGEPKEFAEYKGGRNGFCVVYANKGYMWAKEHYTVEDNIVTKVAFHVELSRDIQEASEDFEFMKNKISEKGFTNLNKYVEGFKDPLDNTTFFMKGNIYLSIHMYKGEVDRYEITMIAGEN